MEGDIFNAFDYDSYLLADKLGVPATYRQQKNNKLPEIQMNKRDSNRESLEGHINARLNEELLRTQLENAKLKHDNEQNKKNREHFIGTTGGCGCEGLRDKVEGCATCGGNKGVKSKVEGCIGCKSDDVENIFNNKVLLLLVFVLATFCVIQYMHMQKYEAIINDLINNGHAKITYEVPKTVSAPPA